MATAVQEKERATTATGPTMNRLAAWWADVRALLRKPRWYIPLLTIGGFWLLENVAADISLRLLGPVGRLLGGILGGLLARPAGVFGIAFFVVVVALVVRGFWETRPQKAKRGGQLWIAQERLKLAETAEQFAKDQIAEDQRELRERDARINELKQALTVAQDEGRNLFQRLQYGDPLIETPPLKDADNAVMRSRVEEMAPNIAGMLSNGQRVWHHLIAQASTHPEKETLGWLITFTEEGTVNQCKRAHKLLRDLLDTHQDPRKGLAALYARYCDWRTWIRRFSELQHHHLYLAPAYRDWFRNDTQFFADLQQRLSTSPFAAVRAAVRLYNENNEPVMPLPDPDRDP